MANKIMGSKIVNILSILLIVLAAVLLLYVIVLYQTHSPEFVTHEQFYSAMAITSTAFFSGLIGVWMNVSGRMIDFAHDLGEIKGALNQLQLAVNRLEKNR